MPWVTIIIWLLTYLLSSSKEGVSKGKAALIATGAAAAAYYVAEPTNANNLMGIGLADDKTVPGDPSVDDSGVTTAGGTGKPVIAPAGTSSTGSTFSNLLSKWGPTAAVAAGGIATGAVLSDNKWLIWGALGLGAYLILK